VSTSHVPPLRELPARRQEARKEHLLSEISGTHRRRAVLLLPLFVCNRRMAVLAPAFGLLMIGILVAATTTDWISSQPSRKSVVAAGDSTPTQPDMMDVNRPMVTAHDGNAALYATMRGPDRYCVVAVAPWKRPTTLSQDEVCIPGGTFVVGVVGVRSSRDGRQTYLVAGRTTDPEARTIHFSDPSGRTVTRNVGVAGFFLAVVRTEMRACAAGSWTPTFSVRGVGSQELMRTTTKLTSARAAPSTSCTFAAPHATRTVPR